MCSLEQQNISKDLVPKIFMRTFSLRSCFQRAFFSFGITKFLEKVALDQPLVVILLEINSKCCCCGLFCKKFKHVYCFPMESSLEIYTLMDPWILYKGGNNNLCMFRIFFKRVIFYACLDWLWECQNYVKWVRFW